ncbi:uncharacterized protein LOC118199494 [Stegodyphus dumicola]|uniref:uncharacterized protein LOC118199494 n=1 Tax=Stegodyphus dumicola TaxID=202533 RepID=UPI0015AE151D|nr:uncharacterized protein LOC118199494 [Stegodyphus dumicola]
MDSEVTKDVDSPKIVVHETSPTSSALSLASTAIADEIDVLPTKPQRHTGDEQPVAVNTGSVQQIKEDNTLAVDCGTSCVISLEKPQNHSSENTDQDSMPPAAYFEHSDDSMRSLSGWSQVFYTYQRCSEIIVVSKFLLPFQFLLLAMPISAGFMAAKYMDKCPYGVAIPILMFMMGIIGTAVILCRMLLIIRKTLLPLYPDWWLLRTIIIFGNLLLILFLCTEMLSFFRSKPSFDPSSPHYCHEVFYFFTYWINWATVFLVLLVTFLHAPSCTMDSLRTDDFH